MPESPCREPLCPEFADIRGRCAKHAKQYVQASKQRTKGRAIYNSKRWAVLRRKVLLRDRYTCQHCGRFGNNVDHAVPVAQGGLEWDTDNLQALCRSCHSRKTAKEVWT